MFLYHTAIKIDHTYSVSAPFSFANKNFMFASKHETGKLYLLHHNHVDNTGNSHSEISPESVESFALILCNNIFMPARGGGGGDDRWPSVNVWIAH